MQFANEIYWVFLALPVMAALGFYRGFARKKRLCAFADKSVLAQIYPALGQERKRTVRSLVRDLLITSLLSLALLRPQWGFTVEENKKKGIDMVVTLDLSESMLAQDVLPNRLERARREILDLLDHLHGDRIALVGFAGVAFIESPLTLDYETFRLFLNTISPSSIPVQGTNLEAALEKSIEAFQLGFVHSGEKLSKTYDRAVIVISDGESRKGTIEKAATLAKKNNIRIYTIGVGTSEGSPIPQGRGYKKNDTGELVITKLRSEALLQLARKTGGIFVESVSSDEDTKAIYDLGMKKSLRDRELQGVAVKRWNEYYQVPLVLGLLLMLFPLFGGLCQIMHRSRKSSSVFSIFSRTSRVLRVFVFVTGYSILQTQESLAESKEALGAQATEAFHQGDFQTALSKFTKGKEVSNDDYRFQLGLGASRYRLGEYEEAKKAFAAAARETKSNPAAKAQALYNAANSLVQLGEFNEALKLYEESLRLAPSDQETKDNLEYTKKLIKEEEKKRQQKNNSQSKAEDSKKAAQNQSAQDTKNSQQSQQSQQKENNQAQQESNDPPPDNSSPSPQLTQSASSGQGEKDRAQEQGKESSESTSEQNKESSPQAKGRTEEKGKVSELHDNEATKQTTASSGDQTNPVPTSTPPNNASGINQTQGSTTTDERISPNVNQIESLLDNMEDSRAPLLRYRKQKAQIELNKHPNLLPENDW